MRNPYSDGTVTFRKDIPITGTGALTVNVFQVIGAVRVVEQVAELVSVTTLTNATNVYADLWDGTNACNLTADGATLSGAPVGSVFTKDKVAANAYSVLLADECRVSEVIDAKKIGRAFTVAQKSGTDTFIRFHLTTTDNPVNFTMHLKFVYEPVDGGRLVYLL
jgi:hypothetical protein